jgi:fructose-1,6-bisphosphatase I
MHDKTVSLTEFILEEERSYPDATGGFTHLLTQIEYAGKIIASHVKKTGLVDILGKTGEVNASQDEVIEIDRFSNNLLMDTLEASGQVYALASEELADFHYPKNNQGEYVVFFDPLDGSSNTEVDITVGTIFSIYKKSDNLLQPGRKQIAAGYILYGTSTMFVYTVGHGVHGFTLDPSIGSFLLSHLDIKMPSYAPIYSINEAYYHTFDERTRKYLDDLKEHEEGLKSRYVGSMVADVHRTLIKGGIFLNPSDHQNPNGKLRLMIEINPLSYIIEQAGGKAISGDKSPLDIVPTTLHDRAPIALGSSENIDKYLMVK